ncbi:MAG: hypothetical protein HY537_11460, partial [Deltaproteobacteria bacterium]|nr:hypothetical protein [Deltaproteobacteria bacterium]
MKVHKWFPVVSFVLSVVLLSTGYAEERHQGGVVSDSVPRSQVVPIDQAASEHRYAEILGRLSSIVQKDGKTVIDVRAGIDASVTRARSQLYGMGLTELGREQGISAEKLLKALMERIPKERYSKEMIERIFMLSPESVEALLKLLGKFESSKDFSYYPYYELRFGLDPKLLTSEEKEALGRALSEGQFRNGKALEKIVTRDYRPLTSAFNKIFSKHPELQDNIFVKNVLKMSPESLASLAQLRKNASEVSQQLDIRDNTISSLNTTVAAQNSTIVGLNKTVATQNAKIDDLKTVVEAGKNTIAARDASIATL